MNSQKSLQFEMCFLKQCQRFSFSSLSRTRQQTTTLGQEMDLVEAYLRTQQVRMVNRVRYIIDLVEAQNGSKAQDKHTQIMTREGESLIRKTIKELAEELAPEQSWQIHPGTIVNVQYVDRVSRSLPAKGGGSTREMQRNHFGQQLLPSPLQADVRAFALLKVFIGNEWLLVLTS